MPLVVSGQILSRDEMPTVTYSELFERRDSFLGKVVRVKATHISGFERSFLCDKGCDKPTADTWVDFADEDELCDGSKQKLRKSNRNDAENRAEVIYVGRLTAGGFGHFGIYRYQFFVTCVEKYKKLPPLD